MEQLPTQWVLAIIAVLVIQAIKDSRIPIFNNEAGKPNAVLAAVFAAAGATGIAVVHSWDAGSGTYTLTVTGLSTGAVLKGLWLWAQQYGWQWMGWKLVKEKV